jgi:hypothetical protein
VTSSYASSHVEKRKTNDMHKKNEAKQTAVMGTRNAFSARSFRRGLKRVLLLAAALCVAPLALNAQAAQESPQHADTKVIVLQPLVEFEILQANATIRAGHYSAREEFEAISAVVAETVASRGMTWQRCIFIWEHFCNGVP